MEWKTFSKFDGKYCPDCNAKLHLKDTFYSCAKCEIDFFEDEIKIKFQKSVVVGVTKTGKLIHRVLPDPNRGYNPPKLTKKLEDFE